MIFSWGTRQTMALLLMAVVLASISGVLGLATVTRIAVDDATSESLMVSQTLLLQIGYVAREASDPIAALRADPRIDLILQAAIAQAPAVVFAAICDTSGNAIAHTTPEKVGSRIDPLPALPRIGSFWQSLRLLGSLIRSPKVYELRTPLLLGDLPFASIRVGIAGVLIRERADQVFRQGLLTAWVQIAIAGVIGFFLARITTRRLRELSVGVAALREGRFDARIPEAGLDEFSRLARDLNLLSEQFQKERLDRDSRIGPVYQTVEHLGKGLITLGPDREILLINTPAARILGVDQKGARGKRIGEVLPIEHPVRPLADRAFEAKNGTLSVVIPQAPGVEEPASAAIAHQIPGLGEREGGVLIEFRDAAALKQLQSLVGQSRVLSRLGQMAVGVAHEIRNPLQAISFELGALRESRELAHEEIDSRVEAISEEIQRLQRAVSGFLKVARLRQPEYAPVQLNDLLDELHRSMEAEVNLAGLEMDLALDPSLPETMCDREVLRQAVQNLITNASQALPSTSGRIELTSRGREGEIVITIKDSGPGIRKEHLEKVCDLYFTTKPGGSGVGLSLVRQAVEMHGGELEIDSSLGSGTTMMLRIPVRPAGDRDS